MSVLERAGLAALRLTDAETAHGIALHALRLGLGPAGGPVATPRLATRLAGLELPNPVGLAAGFDKNATALAALARAGFGWIEVGAATPLPQPGNPRPRVFRLTRDRAVINRYGFNNDGAEAIAARLAAWRATRTGPAASVPVGLNLGANRDSADRAGDYVCVLKTCGPHVDFATINVSSPNTANLRDLQGRAALWGLVARVMDARAALPRRLPIFLKIAPDLDEAALADIAEVVRDSALDAIVATNTTLARPDLSGPHAAEAGGLSGPPLFDPSTRVLARLSALTEGAVPLIGVGGVDSAAAAMAKIRAGATAVQLYTALAYDGLSLAGRIARGLEAALAAEGAGLSALVGRDRAAWLGRD